MCTAITYKTNDFYFGRNLDLYYHYDEAVTVTPRRFPLPFRNGEIFETHYAMIGMATVSNGYPLYYEATNEKGLSMAGLNFPDNAVYYPESDTKKNIAPFELIPYLLGRCSTVDAALAKTENINLWNIPFSMEIPLSPLHWILADKNRCVTLEPVKDGLKIYENPVGVLTNNPPFDYHMHNLTNYINLTANQPENRFGTDLEPYSLGMGAIGLPGDLSSASRFVRAAFTKVNSVSGDSEEESVGQFFHILGSVEQVKGINRVGEGKYEYTVYSCCCNVSKGIYYYTTYNNRRVSAVDMHKENLNGEKIVAYRLENRQQIFEKN